MELKPHIFIGSSKEGLPIAEGIRNGLKDIAEIKLWTRAFDIGKSNYENLITQIALYDYAVMIATADDIVTSRKKTVKGVRDNVLFEFGMFAGGLGRDRALYVLEKGIKIPSDLLGITFPTVSKYVSADFASSLDSCIDDIKKHILDKETTFDLGFLPSTVLAYGYFNNFVEKTVERLLEDKAELKEFTIQNDQQFVIKSLKFTILLPNDLSDDMFKKVVSKRLQDGWQKLKVDPKHVRDYDFSIDVSKATNGELHLVDIPYTLNALNMAIELYSSKHHLGKSERETLLEYREIRNFKKTLDYLIKKSSITKNIVETEIVDI
ncbi:STING domain-containing protein [Mucilaginibacter sp. E4BP6]|uniref:STING domain-containing protein n=1 Tax=Mucilaginibacter sp. E4BP6 TaxID=2723089 RepID=UPI0015CE6A5A|nr:STING domain-containing protein [Mucilaginibacter sp. E4BP6]NYE66040.1 hypothetical protein [Mucilaginibacter sp. E4BP6]